MPPVTIWPAGGDEVVAAITRDPAECMGVAEGDELHAVVKASEMIVGKE